MTKIKKIITFMRICLVAICINGAASAQTNLPPEATIVSPSRNVTITVGSKINFAATASDPNGDAITYSWKFGDSTIPANSIEDPGLVQFNNVGLYTVVLSVTDVYGLADPTPATRKIKVIPPPIAQSNYRLTYVDSQELVGENGAATNAFDGNKSTFWHTEWLSAKPAHPHEIQLDLGDYYNIGGFKYLPRQGTSTNGRVKLFAFYVSDDGVTWAKPAASGTFTSSSSEKLVTFRQKRGRYIRFVALSDFSGNPWTTVAEITVLGLPNSNVAPDALIDGIADSVQVAPGGSVRFLASGSDPNSNYPLSYRWDFFGYPFITSKTKEDPGLIKFTTPGIYRVRLTVKDALGLADPVPDYVTINVVPSAIPQAGWSLLFTDSEETSRGFFGAINAFDGNPATIWHTRFSSSTPPPPHQIQINMGALYDVSGFKYLPRQDLNQPSGRIQDYEFYTSLDGILWGKPVAVGRFNNDGTEKQVLFPQITAQYIRLVALNSIFKDPVTTAAEINVLGVPFSGNHAPEAVITSPASDIEIGVGDSVNFAGSALDSDGTTSFAYRWNFDAFDIPVKTIKDPGLIKFNSAGVYTVTFTVSDPVGRVDATPAQRIVRVVPRGVSSFLPKSNWAVRFTDSEETIVENGLATNIIDGNNLSSWTTEWSSGESRLPHEVQIDLGSAALVDGLGMLPRQDVTNGRINDYRVFVSADGESWDSVSVGQFTNDSSEKRIKFAPKTGQFIRLLATSAIGEGQRISAAELNFSGSCVQPYIKILIPLTNAVMSNNDVQVSSSVCLDQALHAGWGIKYIVDGVLTTEVYSYPYSATFNNLSKSNHIIEAFIIDEKGRIVTGESTYDKVTNIGIGDYYVIIGDSITYGVGDDDVTDNSSRDGRTVEGGYGPILNNLLSSAKGYPQTVMKEGVPGEKAAQGLARLPGIIARHPQAQYFLLQFGTNDSSGSTPVPSGLGLHPGDDGYTGSFKDSMQRSINLIKNEGKQAYLAKLPFTLVSSSRNLRIRNYNRVIDELVAENGISIIPPNFYSYFESHQEQFSDNLHPNGMGYKGMADLWFNALN